MRPDTHKTTRFDDHGNPYEATVFNDTWRERVEKLTKAERRAIIGEPERCPGRYDGEGYMAYEERRKRYE
jgi:hypothetical protein